MDSGFGNGFLLEWSRITRWDHRINHLCWRSHSQFGHFFKYAGDRCDHPYPLERYRAETERLLGVLERRMEGREWIVGGEISIADFAIVPWIACVDEYYNGGDLVHLADHPNVVAWVERFKARPAVQRGLKVGSL